MRTLKCFVSGIIIFVSVFSLLFFLSNKTKNHTVVNKVEEPLVYVTDYGKCYHSEDCHYLSKSRRAKGLYYVTSRGYRACFYCSGIPYGTIKVNYYETEIIDATDEVVIKSIIFASVSVTVYALWCVYRKKSEGKPLKANK